MSSSGRASREYLPWPGSGAALAGDADDRCAALVHHADVAIVDVKMPPEWSDDGLRAADHQVLAQRRPDTGVLCPQYREEPPPWT